MSSAAKQKPSSRATRTAALVGDGSASELGQEYSTSTSCHANAGWHGKPHTGSKGDRGGANLKQFDSLDRHGRQIFTSAKYEKTREGGAKRGKSTSVTRAQHEGPELALWRVSLRRGYAAGR